MLSVRSLSGAYSRWSTMEPAPEAIFMGKVASGVLRRKTTVRSSGASTLSRPANITAGPRLSLIRLIRSKENLTSSAVRLLPLLNFRPSLRVHL